MVQLSFYGHLRRHVDQWQMTVSGHTVGKVLRAATAQHPALRDALFETEDALRPHVRVLVNGRDVEMLQGLETPMQEGAEVRVFPPIGGGAPSTGAMTCTGSPALLPQGRGGILR